jgi:hypothetical protein
MLDRRGPGVKQFFCKREVRRRRFGRSRSSRTRKGGRRQPPRCRARARAAGLSQEALGEPGPRAPFGASESAKAASADFRAAGSGRAGHGRAAFVGRVAPRGARRSVTPRDGGVGPGGGRSPRLDAGGRQGLRLHPPGLAPRAPLTPPRLPPRAAEASRHGPPGWRPASNPAPRSIRRGRRPRLQAPRPPSRRAAGFIARRARSTRAPRSPACRRGR